MWLPLDPIIFYFIFLHLVECIIFFFPEFRLVHLQYSLYFLFAFFLHFILFLFNQQEMKKKKLKRYPKYI